MDFFKDINLSEDGGIYPELIRNRSFEDADTLQNRNFKSIDDKSSVLIIEAEVQSGPPFNLFNRKSLCENVNSSFLIEDNIYYGINIIQCN